MNRLVKPKASVHIFQRLRSFRHSSEVEVAEIIILKVDSSTGRNTGSSGLVFVFWEIYKKLLSCNASQLYSCIIGSDETMPNAK